MTFIAMRRLLVQRSKESRESFRGSLQCFLYPDGDGYYCSQFIAELLPIFKTIPMKFGDEEEEISPFWLDYYKGAWPSRSPRSAWDQPESVSPITTATV